MTLDEAQTSARQSESEATLEDDRLVAYRIESPCPAIRIRPAFRHREWISEMELSWANRCLPLVMASEAGWFLLNPEGFEAVWDGRPDTAGTSITFDGGTTLHPAVASHFGYGILTWSVPLLFRTPSGWNLLARGPSNWPKDGVSPLEGLVETDWSVATFTMNWKITRPHHAVCFEKDEPFCMIVPQRRHDLERFRPILREVKSEPRLAREHQTWADNRHEVGVRKFLGRYARDFETDRASWEKDYYHGTTPSGSRAPEHQTRLRLAAFEEPHDP